MQSLTTDGASTATAHLVRACIGATPYEERQRAGLLRSGAVLQLHLPRL